MTSRFKITVAAAALLAGTGFAYAQGTGMGHEGSSGGGAGVQQSAPSSEQGGAAHQMNHSTQGMSSSQSEERSPAAGSNQRAEESKGGNKEMKAEGREDRTNMKAEGREDRTNMKAEGREDKNNMKAEGREDRTNMNAESKGTEGRTVGQAGAGAKLSTEQRTKITKVIKNERVESVKNVNFHVSVGTRVPHDVAFHPLPADVVTIYPEWRGYNFILVRDEIVVIDPHTYEIVAVINS
ncbi:MAG TPA: DUF1236 domain-containing protein [Bradyrhizobium sp.]|nr:DUF1236 domain-containing protein [Bradyrhizobium sp.]